MKKQFSHAATVFQSTEPLKIAHFYRDYLGFDITFTWQNPPEYIVMNREESVSIHITRSHRKVDPQSIYIFVYNVDEVYKEISERGLKVDPPENRDYAMRDFDVRDPDGNLVCMGTAVERMP